MKKLLLSLGLAVGAFFSMSADTAEVTFSTLGYANAADVTAVSLKDAPISLALDKGSNNNAPKYYNTGTGLRMYDGNTMTISVPEGQTITNIVFTASASNYAVKGNVDTGTFSQSDATSTWTGYAQ